MCVVVLTFSVRSLMASKYPALLLLTVLACVRTRHRVKATSRLNIHLQSAICAVKGWLVRGKGGRGCMDDDGGSSDGSFACSF